MQFVLGYRPALDGLRAIAVLLVILHHGAMSGFSFGYVGVDIFFVLSGYLITSTLIREHDLKGNISLVQFWRRRALRLFPALGAFIAVFILYAMFVLKLPKTAFSEGLVSILYVANWTRVLDLDLPVYVGHVWSLAVEEQFYLIWPLVFVGLIRLRREHRPYAVAAMAIFFITERAYIDMHGGAFMRMYNATDTRCDGLLIGAALAFALPNVDRDRIRQASFLWPVFVGIFVWTAAHGNWVSHYLYRWGFPVMALSCAAVISIIVVSGRGELSTLLSARPLVWVGQRSYGLYLWHGLISHELDQRTWYFWPLYIGLTFAAATISYSLLERRYLERRYASPVAATGEPDNQAKAGSMLANS